MNAAAVAGAASTTAASSAASGTAAAASGMTSRVRLARRPRATACTLAAACSRSFLSRCTSCLARMPRAPACSTLSAASSVISMALDGGTSSADGGCSPNTSAGGGFGWKTS